MKELIEIQSKLNVPKSEFNPFGKFHYRSAESILAALKPLLKEQNCYLNLTDELVLIGERYYIKAIVQLVKNDGDEEEFVQSVAYAREADHKTGMDPMQITGAASSYARKYALNGLFAIDDTKDADAQKPDDKPAVTVTGTSSTGTVVVDTPEPTKPWLNPSDKNWAYSVKRLSEGVSITDIEKVFRISKENKKKLIEESTPKKSAS